jgi:hypothetical protein
VERLGGSVHRVEPCFGEGSNFLRATSGARPDVLRLTRGREYGRRELCSPNPSSSVLRNAGRIARGSARRTSGSVKGGVRPGGSAREPGFFLWARHPRNTGRWSVRASRREGPRWVVLGVAAFADPRRCPRSLRTRGRNRLKRLGSHDAAPLASPGNCRTRAICARNLSAASACAVRAMTGNAGGGLVGLRRRVDFEPIDAGDSRDPSV